MSEETQLIIETANRIFTDLATKDVLDAAEGGIWPKELWDTLVQTGLTLAGLSEKAGGSGGELLDSLEIVRRSGFYAAPVPIAETLMTAILIQEAGGEVSTGPMTLAADQFEIRDSIKGTASQVPFAPCCQQILLVDSGRLALVSTEDIAMNQGKNMAGEPVADLEVDIPLPPGKVWELDNAYERMMETGALVRAYQMTGALESILEQAVKYSLEREQFGRPISRFQAIQHQLAVVAGEVAAAGKATDRAGELLDGVHIAAAKSRTGEAAGIAAESVHQVLGAIGYTLEHELNHRTRRLWGWRDDFGNESYWNSKLGGTLSQKGGDALWNFITQH